MIPSLNISYQTTYKTIYNVVLLICWKLTYTYIFRINNMSLISLYGRSILSQGINKTLSSRPLFSSVGVSTANTIISSIANGSLSSIEQRRWKTRGNTYQPSTLKRKRKFGFLARMKDKFKSKMIKSRKEKGRWYLSH